MIGQHLIIQKFSFPQKNSVLKKETREKFTHEVSKTNIIFVSIIVFTNVCQIQLAGKITLPTLGKAVGSLGDFHDDLKSLFDTENIMKASAEFFEQKISSKVEQEV